MPMRLESCKKGGRGGGGACVSECERMVGGLEGKNHPAPPHPASLSLLSSHEKRTMTATSKIFLASSEKGSSLGLLASEACEVEERGWERGENERVWGDEKDPHAWHAAATDASGRARTAALCGMPQRFSPPRDPRPAWPRHGMRSRRT